jgi:hypothetical protein
MAVIFEAAYSKKLGLPNYSSHSYVVSVRVELQDISQVPEESTRLYKLLQEAVDKEIQEVGFMPDATAYGMNNGSSQTNGQRHHNGNNRPNGEGTPITPKQLDLINRVVRENNIPKDEVEQMAIQMFNAGVSQLNRMQASNLIDELFDQYGRRNGNGHRGKYQQRERVRA